MTNALQPQAALVSPKRLAELYPDLFTVPTLQRWRTEGVGPPYSLCGPRRIAYRIPDIEAWLTTRSVASTADAREKGLAA
jgi:hypothetical protein